MSGAKTNRKKYITKTSPNNINMASNDKKDPLINLVDKVRSFLGLGNHPKNQTGMPSKTRFSIWYLIIAMILFSYLQPLLFSSKTETISYSHFKQCVDQGIAGEIVAFQESGHAIVAESIEHADPVHKKSIFPRGIAALGYTQQQPTQDRYLVTRSELTDRLAVLLGGRVAEKLVFNEISTGAQNDLQRALNIARAMVTEYGMSDSLGLVSYERPRQTMFLPENFSPGKNYSEAKAA